MSKKIEEIVAEIKKLSILEVNDLVKAIEKEFDVVATLQAAGANAADSDGSNAEPTEVNLILKSFGGNKVAVIKIVKEITGIGLMDAKKLVESAPTPIKEKIKPDVAKELGEKLIATGAEIEIK